MSIAVNKGDSIPIRANVRPITLYTIDMMNAPMMIVDPDRAYCLNMSKYGRAFELITISQPGVNDEICSDRKSVV